MRPTAEQKKFAKSLYMSLSDTGKPIYNLSDVLREMEKKIEEGVNFSRVTKQAVHMWVKKNGWDVERQQIIDDLKYHIAERDRAEILELGASTFELSRRRNDNLYERLFEIIREKITHTIDYMHGQITDPEEVKRKCFTNAQLINIFSRVSQVKMEQDALVAESAKMMDNKIDFNLRVITDEQGNESSYEIVEYNSDTGEEKRTASIECVEVSPEGDEQ